MRLNLVHHIYLIYLKLNSLSCILFLLFLYLLYPRASQGRTWGWGSCSAHSPGTPSSPSPSYSSSTEDQRLIDQWVDQCSYGFTRRSVHHSLFSSSIRFTLYQLIWLKINYSILFTIRSIHWSAYPPVDQQFNLITTRSTYWSFPHVDQLIDSICL